jgi:hypothetical protein
MKSLGAIFTLLLLSVAFGCTREPTANNAARPSASTGQAATSEPTPARAATPNRTPRADETAERTESNFEGTAGITEEKNEIAYGSAILREVRTGEHTNFDRIVFEFDGREVPGYHIEYIDKPVHQCGSGDVVALAGDGWLEVRMYTQAHDENGRPTVAVRELAPNHKTVKELKQTCDFEGEVTWVAGLASPNKYGVLELKNPARLVIDVKH